MARNGVGTYVLPAGQPVVTNTTISSTVFNALTSDLANALTTSVCTDGQTPMAANLRMGSYKITDLANGVASTDAANKGQIDASAISTAASAVTTALANTQAAIPGRNMLHNSRMLIAQRGTTYALTTSAAFGSLDRWSATMVTSAAGIFNQVAAPAQSGFANTCKLGRTAGSSLAGQISIGQACETTMSVRAASKTVILSFYAYAGANYSSSGNVLGAIVRTGTGTNQSTATLIAGTWTGTSNVISQTPALTTTLTRYEYTGSVPATATQIGVMLFYTPTGTAGADDNVYITGVQLEVAQTGQTSASSLEQLDYTTDLNSCLRFYQRVNFTVVGYSSAGGSILAGGTLPVQMRIVPTPAQISNNYSLTGANTTLTTSVYVNNDLTSAYAYRVVNVTAAAQFSELASLTADL